MRAWLFATLAILLPANQALAWDWSGFYVGGQGGYAQSDMPDANQLSRELLGEEFDIVVSGDPPTFPEFFDILDQFGEFDLLVRSDEGEGGFVGLYAGYTWQHADFVYGLRADVINLNLSTSTLQSLGYIGGGAGADVDIRLDNVATFRGSAGWGVGRFLFSATGGLALVDADAFVSTGATALFGQDIGFSNRNYSGSEWLVGGTIGARAEFAVAENVSISVDYQHIRIPELDLDGEGFSTGSQPASIAFEAINMIAAGVSLRF